MNALMVEVSHWDVGTWLLASLVVVGIVGQACLGLIGGLLAKRNTKRMNAARARFLEKAAENQEMIASSSLNSDKGS